MYNVCICLVLFSLVVVHVEFRVSFCIGHEWCIQPTRKNQCPLAILINMEMVEEEIAGKV